MATPRQILAELGQHPTETTIAHEVGHTAVAYFQVATVVGRNEECSIVFRHHGHGEGAAAHNPIKHSTPRELVMRSLAGIMIQAQVYEETVEADLRARLWAGSLFGSAKCFKPNSPEALAMEHNQAWSDWDKIMMVSRAAWPKYAARLKELRAAQTELVALCESARFKAIIGAMITDIAQWLDHEQGEVDLLARYPESRIAAVFAQHPP